MFLEKFSEISENMLSRVQRWLFRAGVVFGDARRWETSSVERHDVNYYTEGYLNVGNARADQNETFETQN